MSTINKALGASGAGITLEVLGQTWHFTPLTKLAQGDIESWMEYRAWSNVRRAKPHLDPEEYAALLTHTQAKIDAGEYSILPKVDKAGNVVGESQFQKMVKTEEGLKFFISLLLKPNHPDITPARAWEIFNADSEGVIMAMNQLFEQSLTPAATDQAA